MPKKVYKPEEIVAKLRQADVLITQGSKIPYVVCAIGVTQVIYYRWRYEFGGLPRLGEAHASVRPLRSDQLLREKRLSALLDNPQIQNQRNADDADCAGLAACIRD